jgi:hypothetical protein
VKKLIGALTFVAVGACMAAPANAVVVLQSVGDKDTLTLSLPFHGIQEIQIIAAPNTTDDLMIASTAKTALPLSDFVFASFESGNVPKTLKLALPGPKNPSEVLTFTAGSIATTWDIFVGYNPFDSWKILTSGQPITFSLAEISSILPAAAPAR